MRIIPVVLVFCLFLNGSPLAVAFDCVSEELQERRARISIHHGFEGEEEVSTYVYKSLSASLELPGVERKVPPANVERTAARQLFHFCIAESNLPKTGGIFVFRLANRRIELVARPVKWLDAKSSITEPAQAVVGSMPLITLDNQPVPDWPIFATPRLLRSTEDGVILVEMKIENRSSHPLALNGVRVVASHPKNPSINCRGPDSKQDVTLDWEKILDSRGEDGVWTNLNSDSVQVTAEYSGRGHCSSRSFIATVPVQSEVPSGVISRLTLRFVELPKAGSKSLDFIPSDDPVLPLPDFGTGSIAEWESFVVQIDSQPSVFPVNSAVSK